MTRHAPAALQAHARALAQAFTIRLIESDQLRPEEAFGLLQLRAVFCGPVIDETTYAVALHELGHLAAPTGIVRHVASGDVGNLQRVEEDAAWTWARHYALEWTPVMDAVARWAEGTYAAPRRPVPPAPAAPAAPPAPRIDWSRYR